MESLFIGLILVIVAGLGTGTMSWPVKRIGKFHFEYFLFVSMFTGLIVVPWTVFLIAVPSPLSVLKAVGARTLILTNLISISWGVANILYLICVIRIGAAVTGATLTALGMGVGVLMPMLVKGSGSFKEAPDLLSPAGGVIIVGLLVMMTAIFLITRAGLLRESITRKADSSGKVKVDKHEFINGMLLAVLAGVLSSGISLAFVYGQSPVVNAVAAAGGSNIAQSFSVWALAIAGGGLVNVFYALYLMIRRKTLLNFFSGSPEILYGGIVGLQFIFSIVLMGKGMLMLGALGASVGFAVQQSSQIMGNQLVGFWNGEWRGVNGESKRLMRTSLIIILVATCLIAYSNTL